MSASPLSSLLARRLVAVLGTVLLLLTSVVAAPVLPAFAADPPPGLAVSADAPESVLLGERAEITLTATNPADGPELFNLSFRYVLPEGVEYAGTDHPLGDPEVREGENGETVLVWVNVSDLPSGGQQQLSFDVTAGVDVLPVGSAFDTVAQAYASDDERTVPKFDGHGTYTGDADAGGTSAPRETRITAIQVTKSEPSPEHELVRGVHDNVTTYTLTVKNNRHYANTEVVVVDHLPAQLEFLGCGGVDNSSAREYDGAPALGATTVDDCVEPFSVTTVEDPEGLPVGVYTRVEWRLGDLDPDDEVTIEYTAGIPQRANTMAWDSGLPTGHLAQAANLDNNNGPSTRETASEQALTNHAEVTALYTGPMADGVTCPDDGEPCRVGDTDELTVTAEDLAIHKSVAPTTFEHGEVATYTLTVRTGEYATAADVVITDVLPDGLCPLGMGQALCDDADGPAGSAPSHGVASVTQLTGDAPGAFEVEFDALTLPENGELVITYDARMLTTYTGIGAPTVAGDGFTNRVSLTGGTTVLPEVDAPEPTATLTVTDTSSAHIAGGTVQLDKYIQPNTGGTDYLCSTDPAAYVKDDGSTDVTFGEGSRICFLLDVQFPTTVDTKNPVLRDFLPEGLRLEAGSGQVLASAEPPVAFTVVGADGLTFALGTEAAGNRFANAGERFLYAFSAIVDTPAQPNQVDVTGNLAKLRWTNTDGQVSFLRDRVDFRVAAVPPLGISKTGATEDVVAGSVVPFEVTLTNSGTTENGNARTVVAPEVWDLLPPGITCADVSDISSPGSCMDPGAPGHPAHTGDTPRSVIRWQLPETVTIVPGASYSGLTYTVTYPEAIAAGATYTNDAYVRSYESLTNIGGGDTVEHFPADNVDPSVDPEDVDAPEAHDDHVVTTPAVDVTKSNVTSVDDETQGSEHTTNSYVAIGEQVTYTVVATLPANTTIYNGVIQDDPPSNIRVDTVAYRFSADDGGSWGALPAGWTTDGVTVTLPQLPGGHTVGNQPHLVEMTMTATVVAPPPTPAPSHGESRVNTVTMTSSSAAGTPSVPVSDSSAVTVVHPNPSPVKAVDDDEPGATDTVTYTVTARNTAPGDTSQMRPTLFDTVVVDCVPAGLVVDTDSVAISVGDAATAVEINPPGHGCDTGTTAIVWQVGDLAWRSPSDIDSNPWPTLTYSVTIDPGAGGGREYVNTVIQTGTSMAGTDDDEISYTGRTEEPITVPGGGLTKAVSPAVAPVGDAVTYTVTADVPARVNLYDATVVDDLPPGIDPSSIDTVSVTWTYADGSVGTPDPGPQPGHVEADGTIRWFFGDVAADANHARVVTIVYTAVVDPTVRPVGEHTARAGDEPTNAAYLAWNHTDKIDDTEGPDPDTDFDHSTPEAEATVRVLEPSLTIGKSVDDATPAPGETFEYTVTIANASGANRSAAHDVTVVDDVPAGVVVDPGSIEGGGTLTGADADTGAGGTITWVVDQIAVGGSVTFTYEAVLARPTPVDTDLDPVAQTNTVTVTEYFSLPDKGGRDYTGPSTDATVTPALPELVIEKTLLDDTPSYRGTPVRWQLEVSNVGDATAHDVDVVDVLPPGWTYDEGTARVAVGSAGPVALEPDRDGDELTWSAVGALTAPDADAAGARMLITFSATPGPTAAVDAVHTNTARTSGKDLPGGEVVTEDEDTATTRIDSADLRILKVANGDAVAGDPFSWTLTVSNAGPNPAAGPITVTDVVPAGVRDVAAVGTDWAIDVAPGEAGTTVVTATRTAALAAGSTAPAITITGTLAADLAPGTDLVNTAEVESPTHDPDEPNNEDSTTTTVTTVSDMGVVKDAVGDLVPGTDLTYTIDVTNQGPSAAHGEITVVDTLPGGVTYQSFTGTDWELRAQDGQQLTFVHTGAAPVAVGALPQLQVVVSTDPGLTEAVTNTVTVHEPSDPTAGPEAPDTDEVTLTPGALADLAIAKRHLGEKMLAGDTAQYELTVTNFGPSDAAGPLTVTDVLPDGLTFVSAASDEAWDCAADGQDVTCLLPGGLRVADGSTTLVLTVDVDESLPVDERVENTATVEGPTEDPHEPNNTDGDDSTIDVLADLGITKVLVTDPVVAGEEVVYELTVRNHGTSTSPAGIVVADTLPDGLTLVSATGGTDWTCALDGRVIECGYAATLPSGTDAPVITVTALVDSGLGTTTLTNIASVHGPAPDPTPDNNTSHEPTPVTEDTELVITKTTVGADPVRAGEEATFEIAVANVGSSDARTVVVEDVLPAGTTLVSASGTGWDCVDGTCTTDRVVAGTTAPVITVVARVASSVPDGTVLVNRAEVSTVTPGDDPADNTDQDDVSVVAEADLGITKDHTGEAVAGSPTTFTITVTNHGPSDAVGPITVTDTLPDGMTFLSAGAPWTCDGTDVVECVLADGLPAGATAPVLDVQVQVAASVGAGPLTNVARVDSPTTDPEPDNDEDTETVDVELRADVSVTKSHTGPVRVGDDLTFTLRVRNGGPSPAQDVVVVDTLPEGLVATGAAGDGWVCDVTDGEVRCELEGPLGPRTDAPAITVTATVMPAAYPSVENVAEVSTSTPDPAPDNDRTTDTVEVPAQVDLAIEKSLVGDLVVGERATYELVVTNHGPTAAPGPVTVTDRLPDGLTYAGRSCDATGATVTCVLDGPLDVGESVTVTVLVEVGAGAYPEVVNTATVSSPAEDVDPRNDSSSVTSPVAPAVTGGEGTTATPTQQGGALARTGGAALWLAAVATLLMLGGAGLVRRSRRAH